MSDTLPPSKPPPPRRRWLPWAAGTVAIMLVAALGVLACFGAFGGRLYYDLPAAPAAAHAAPDVAVVIFSSDTGFRAGLGPQVAKRIAAAGIPVTGVNSLVYFRKARTADEVRPFIEAAMAHARTKTGAKRLILIGYSFGADLLHVGLATLPPAERRTIQMAALLVPTDTVYFHISPGEMFEWDQPDVMALPTARQLDWLPVLCLQGAAETESLCPLLQQANVQHIALPGGHKLDGDGKRLASAVLGWIEEPRNQPGNG